MIPLTNAKKHSGALTLFKATSLNESLQIPVGFQARLVYGSYQLCCWRFISQVYVTVAEPVLLRQKLALLQAGQAQVSHAGSAHVQYWAYCPAVMCLTLSQEASTKVIRFRESAPQPYRGNVIVEDVVGAELNEIRDQRCEIWLGIFAGRPIWSSWSQFQARRLPRSPTRSKLLSLFIFHSTSSL